MQDFRLALAQIAPVLGDVGRNLTRHLDVVGTARKQGADLVVFPELSLCGYVLLDQVPEVALTLDDKRLVRLARASRELDLIVGFVEETEGHRFHNAAAYFSKGRLLHIHRKLYLPTYGMFQEGRDMAPGDTLRRFDAPHGPSGMLICEDLWHQTCAWLLAQQGAEIIFALSNGPTRGAKRGRRVTSLGVWESLLTVSAKFLTAYFVYVNRVGCEDGLTFGGGSMVVDPFGRVISRLPALDEAIETIALDREVLRRSRMAYPLLRDENLEVVRRELDRLHRLRYELPPADRTDRTDRTDDEPPRSVRLPSRRRRRAQ